ncbi:MAG: aminopeptidase [Hyphomicrobiaceae bacterium]|nr:aminopeptidase [Hyphomicrobiaceae bacterium]MCC0024301.1 aminopeptidase [Hyphomicrobiaceae bacterium]
MSVVDPEMLNKLGEVAVKVGLRLQKGQDLVMTSSIEAAPLARAIAEHAYKQGAAAVITLFSDADMSLMRFQFGHDEIFDYAPDYIVDAMAKAFDNNAARLAIAGDDPMMLANEDPDKVGRANKAQSAAYTPVRERITRFNINWNIVAYPGKKWAELVFPDKKPKSAQKKLAKAVFAASRIDVDDPISAWNEHNTNLRTRADWLNENRFSSLHFSGPGTDLTVGLADQHLWMGGEAVSKNGVWCNPNIPTEEVFTTPHAHRVNGTVRSTKPLSHNGTLIEDIEVRFEQGRIVEARASKGQDVFIKLLDTDEGARRIGEVALVPHSSPISQTGLLFYNTLFDENAASHIALGQSYWKCFTDGDTVGGDEVAARGGNSSHIHVDWMIGSNKINVDGIKENGDRVPVMRKGEWA